MLDNNKKKQLLRLSPNRVFWLSFSLMTLSWLVWWIAFYPGIMSSDSLDMWAQAQTFNINNWHPYLYSLTMGLLKYIVYSPSMMGLLQILLTSTLIAWIARFAYEEKVKPLWIILVVSLYALHPQFGTYNIIIWKDVIFSGLLLTQAFIIYLAVSVKRQSWWPYITLGLLAGMSVFIRTNGIINLILPAIMLITVRIGWKRTGALIFSGIISYLFFGIILFNALHIGPSIFQVNQLRLKVVGAIYSMPNPKLTSQEKAIFEGMWPADVWREGYSPASSDQLFFNYWSNLPKVQRIVGHKPNKNDELFYKNWKRSVVSAAMRNPLALAQDKLKQVGIFWTATNTADGLLGGDGPSIQAQILAKYPRPETVIRSNKFPRAQLFYSHLLHVSTQGFAGRVFWTIGGVFWIYIIIFVYVIVKRFRATLFFLLFILINLAFVIAVSPASDYRYIYFVYLAAPTIPLLVMSEQGRTSVEI